MILKNAEILNGAFKFVKADVKITDGIIEKTGSISSTEDSIPEEEMNLAGLRVIPGLIDMHIHASFGKDVCDATPEALQTISSFLSARGVTSFAATSMSLSREGLSKAFKNVRDVGQKGLNGAYLQGINMEGPYISPEKRGAQNLSYIRPADIEEFESLNSDSGGMIRVVDVAPETENAMDFIKLASKICTVSIAHTTADYETAMEAFRCGAKHATHLFNAMVGLKHREPGTVGAVFDSSATAELICDGIHIHPAVIRSAWKILGPDRVVLISDAMAAAGMPEGEYMLGGLNVFVNSRGEARLKDGTLAGSTANLMQCVRNAVKFGIAPENAIKAATINPAKVLGCDKAAGSIEPGKSADLVVIDRDFNIKHVIIKGKIIKTA